MSSTCRNANVTRQGDIVLCFRSNASVYPIPGLSVVEIANNNVATCSLVDMLLFLPLIHHAGRTRYLISNDPNMPSSAKMDQISCN